MYIQDVKLLNVKNYDPDIEYTDFSQHFVKLDNHFYDANLMIDNLDIKSSYFWSK